MGTFCGGVLTKELHGCSGDRQTIRHANEAASAVPNEPISFDEPLANVEADEPFVL